jgi:hypothetical protein
MFSWAVGDKELEFFKRDLLHGDEAALFETDGKEHAVGF